MIPREAIEYAAAHAIAWMLGAIVLVMYGIWVLT